MEAHGHYARMSRPLFGAVFSHARICYSSTYGSSNVRRTLSETQHRTALPHRSNTGIHGDRVVRDGKAVHLPLAWASQDDGEPLPRATLGGPTHSLADTTWTRESPTTNANPEVGSTTSNGVLENAFTRRAYFQQ